MIKVIEVIRYTIYNELIVDTHTTATSFHIVNSIEHVTQFDRLLQDNSI